MNALERRVACPSCTRELRLTEPELLDKRGFCPACDARFDLLPEMFVGDGPMRSMQVTTAALPDVPPSGKIRLEGERGDRIVIATAKRFPAWSIMFSIFWYGFLAFWITMASRGNSVMPLFGLFFVIAGVIPLRLALLEIRGRATIDLGPGGLDVQRRGAFLTSREHIGYEDVVSVRAEEAPLPMMKQNRNAVPQLGQRLAIIRRGAEPIYLAEGLGHTRDGLHWVAARLEQASRAGRRR